MQCDMDSPEEMSELAALVAEREYFLYVPLCERTITAFCMTGSTKYQRLNYYVN